MHLLLSNTACRSPSTRCNLSITRLMAPPLMSELTQRMTDRSHFLETPSAAGTLVGEERLWSATSLTVRLAPLINERRVKAADSSSNFLPENPKSNIQIIQQYYLEAAECLINNIHNFPKSNGKVSLIS